jgi:hypothetical protein
VLDEKLAEDVDRHARRVPRAISSSRSSSGEPASNVNDDPSP